MKLTPVSNQLHKNFCFLSIAFSYISLKAESKVMKNSHYFLATLQHTLRTDVRQFSLDKLQNELRGEFSNAFGYTIDI